MGSIHNNYLLKDHNNIISAITCLVTRKGQKEKDINGSYKWKSLMGRIYITKPMSDAWD